MGLERILRKGLASAALLVALGSGNLSCTDSEKVIPHFEVKYALTDANGVARFVDNEMGEFSVTVLNGDGTRSSTEGALVTYFDGEDGNAMYTQHPDFSNPDFRFFTDDDLATASLTVSSIPTWEGWALVGSSAEHDIARDYVEWASQEAHNGFGYYGCSTFQKVETGHKFGSHVYAAAQRLGPVAAVNTISDNMTRVWNILAGQSEEGSIEHFEAEECEAFQFFGFIPNYDGWTSPTGGIVIPFCYTPTDTEIYTDNGVDDNCNGIIDEGVSNPIGDDDDVSDDDDFSDDDDSTPAVSSCTGSEYLCDDFENGSLRSIWELVTGSVSESDGRLLFNSNSTIRSNFPIEVGSNQYNITLLSDIVAGYNSSVRLGDDYNGWIRVQHYQGTVTASCKPGYGDETIFEGDTISLSIGSQYDLEISAYGGHASVFVNNQVLLTRDNCFGGPGDTRIELRLANGSGDAMEIERIEVDEF